MGNMTGTYLCFPSKPAVPYFSFALICLLFGSNFILMARAGAAFGPVAVGAGRVVGAATVLLLIWRLVTPSARIPRQKWFSCLLVGLVANGYPYVVQPYLIRQALAMNEGAGHSFFGVMVAFTPLLTILVSPLMLGVWPTARQVIGVVVGLGFMALLVDDGSHRGVTPLMLLLAFSVPLSYACANTYLRRELNDLPVTALSAMMLLAPALLLVPLACCDSLLQGFHLGAPTEPLDYSTAVMATAILGVFGTGLTMWLFVRLVQTQGPLFAGMVTYVVPLIALSWGAFDGEMITTRQMVAITGVLAMVAFVQYGATQPSGDLDNDPNDSSSALRRLSS